MRITNLFKKILAGIYISIRRFPAAICMTTATAAMLIVLNEIESTAVQSTFEILQRITMIIALGIPLSLCIKHIAERYESIKPVTEVLLYAFGAGLLVLYYFFMLPDFKMVPVTRYIAISAALYIAFVLFPYFYRRSHFELYAIKLFLRFLVTILYSGVLFAGLAAILFTIDKLLLINIDEKMYLYVWLTIAGVFAPCFFLAGIPSYGQELDENDYSKLLKILLLYIIMPLIAAYTTILYIYFAKIIITLSWPEGLVAHLVLWYSIISAAVIFLTTPLKIKDKWVQTFIFWYIKLVLPILIIMFVSIGIRINAYGLTENRYFVVALGLWVTGIMLYLNFSRIKRSMIMPVSLAIIAVLSVIGPWSAYSLSMLSQNIRLENYFEKYDILKNGSIVKPSSPVSDKDKQEISSVLRYFENSHSLKEVTSLPDDFNLTKMEEYFGFNIDSNIGPFPDKGYFSYNLKMLEEPIDLSGYDYMFSFLDYQQLRIMKKDNLEIRYDNKNTNLWITLDGKEIYKRELTDFVKELHEKHKGKNNSEITLEDMTFEDGNNDIKLKFILNNIYGNEDTQTGEIALQGASFYVLVGK